MQRILIFIFLVVSLSAFAGEGTQPNIFLITIDTLRADHVACYGYSGVKTPAIDALAEDGIRFSNAFTPSPITNSSHASILTGLYPSSHGVSDFGVPLAPEHVTWASVLQKHGYRTGAFIGAVILDSKTLAPGFDQGFDFYDNFPARGAKKSHWGTLERRGMEVVEHGQQWLERHRAGPRFVWVHLYDPHDPYEPPPPYSTTYSRNLYDGEIAYADYALGRFIQYLRQHGWYDGSIIILVGDHGEGLGEHKENTHGIFLYDSTLHVPLILKLPRNRKAGTVISSQVRSIDILPTVLELAGFAPPAGLDGQSLQPLLASQTGQERPLFGETDYPLHFGYAPLRCVRAENAKLIEAPRPELYDLRADASEIHNVYEPWNPAVQKLRGLIAERQSKTKNAKRSDTGPVDPNTVAELHALGYLGPEGSTSVPEPSLLPDPKDKIEVLNLLHEAMLESDRGQPERARAALKKALEGDSTSVVALSQFGQIELEAGHSDAAAGYLKKARELRPDDASVANNLGRALFATNDLAGARAALEASLKLLPGQFDARLLLGRVYLKLQDLQAAEDQLEAAMLIQPDNPDAGVELGRVFLAQKKYPEAAEELGRAAKRRPSTEVYELLSQTYASMGKKDLAREWALRASKIRGGNAAKKD